MLNLVAVLICFVQKIEVRYCLLMLNKQEILQYKKRPCHMPLERQTTCLKIMNNLQVLASLAVTGQLPLDEDRCSNRKKQMAHTPPF